MSDKKVNHQGEQASSLLLGFITGPQGLKGWVKVYSYTRPLGNLFSYDHWQLVAKLKGSAQLATVSIEHYTNNGKKLSVKLKGVNDRNAAEELTGAQIHVSTQQLEALQSDEFYWHQLMGLTVINHDEQVLGVVKELMETGANDVLVVEHEQTRALTAVPWLPDVVISTDLEAGVLRVDWRLDDEDE